MSAYSELYIESSKRNLSVMTDYVANDVGMDLGSFFILFSISGIAAQFEKGNPRFIVGMSGIELAGHVFDKVGIKCHAKPGERFERSREFWMGDVVAYYQWLRGCSFSEIIGEVTVPVILQMYDKYHEMDYEHFCSEIDRLRRVTLYARGLSRLKKRRLDAGLSQRELAERSGIPVRSIQQYEQGQKDIGRAAVSSVIKLATALECDVKEIL